MNNKSSVFNRMIHNDKIVLLVSFIIAVAFWVVVSINVSPETTRIITGVKVNIDMSVPEQFGLTIFGKSDYTVDVTVTGKKYVVSNTAFSEEDIVVTALTNNVDSSGTKTLTLKAESGSGSDDYKISSLSIKSIDVYFDTEKSIELPIETDIIGSNIVAKGYMSGETNLSQPAVTVTGPSNQINRIKKAVARLSLSESLSSNKSSEVDILLLDEKGNSNFKYVQKDIETVTLTIPVFRTKNVETTVLFKNAPEYFVKNLLSYTINPAAADFKLPVEDFDTVDSVSVGTVDFKTLSPSNSEFVFTAENSVDPEMKFRVDVSMKGISEEYIEYKAENIAAVGAENNAYKISGLDKFIHIAGTGSAISDVTADAIKVTVDLSSVELEAGQTKEVVANVVLDNPECWVVGTYTVNVSM